MCPAFQNPSIKASTRDMLRNVLILLENRERERSSDANDSLLYSQWTVCIYIYIYRTHVNGSVKERDGWKDTPWNNP